MPPFFQRIFAPLAFHGVLRILAGFQALMFVLMMILGPGPSATYLDMLALDFGRVLHGEVWRLISFLAIPPANPFSNFGTLWLVFSVLFLFMVNDILESEWGMHGLNAFFYLGFIGCILGGIVIWMVRPDLPGLLAFNLPFYFAAACVMAAGTVAPKVEIRLFFFLPVPLAVVAILSGLSVLLGVLRMLSLHPVLGLVPLLGIAHYLIWVLPMAFQSAARAATTRERRARFERAKTPESAAFHTCSACGATDTSHPDREFRVTVDGEEKCDACLGGKD